MSIDFRARAALAEPEPPDDGEVAELAAKLRTKAITEHANGCDYSAVLLTRAADLLERLAVTGAVGEGPSELELEAIEPVSVSKRLPGPEDCDAEGRCWFCTPSSYVMDANWVYRKAEHRRSWDTHWLPAHGLPLPTGDDA